MYLRVIFLLSICSVCWAGDLKLFKRSIENESKRCQPGDRWREQCNSCFCGSKGVPFCTTENCHMPPSFLPNDFVVSCDTGSRWRDGCETCFCTVQGVPECSPTPGCVESSNSNRQKRDIETTDDMCKSGTTKRTGSVFCYCIGEGVYRCRVVPNQEKEKQ